MGQSKCMEVQIAVYSHSIMHLVHTSFRILFQKLKRTKESKYIVCFPCFYFPGQNDITTTTDGNVDSNFVGSKDSPKLSFWYRLNKLFIEFCSVHQFQNLQVGIGGFNTIQINYNVNLIHILIQNCCDLSNSKNQSDNDDYLPSLLTN